VNEKWWVSQYNFIDEVKRGLSLPKKLRIYDVTLRDGEQTPGVVFGKAEKIRIAMALDELGVERIEAGMPVVTLEDKNAVKEIAGLGLSAETWGFCRCIKNDVDACLECDVDGVVCEISTSAFKLRAYGMSEDQALAKAIETVSYAKAHGLRVAFFGVDITRARLDFLERIYTTTVRECHADEVVLTDTLGVALPEVMYYLTKKVKEWVTAPVHVHCHNDFGLATAGELAAIRAGAEWAHVTVNGIGEKAGNTDLAEVALSAHLLYGLETSIKYEKLCEVSKLVGELSGINVPPTKPIVGPNVFRRESGVAVLQLLQFPPAVESYLPELVGAKREIVLGKKSGKHSIRWKLDALGIGASDEQIDKILQQVKEQSQRNKALVTDESFRKIAREVIRE